MPEYIIKRTREIHGVDVPYTIIEYVGQSGFFCYSRDKAYRYNNSTDLKIDLDYFERTSVNGGIITFESY